MKNKITFSWISPSLEVRTTRKYGKGVFTKKNIRKDSLLAIFGGHIYTIKEEKNIPEEIRDNGLQIHDNIVIGIINNKEIEDAIYFNHSCEPNSGFKGQLLLISMKDIKKDEQITFDYSMVLSSSKKNSYKMKCLCGSKNCRGIIDEEGWKNPKLQKKYKGYFQWYLEEKIKKLNKKSKK
jgi:hypothetical protein